MFRSSEIIDMVLKSLGVEMRNVSNYQDYTLPNGDLLRLRISDHGINLSTWHRKNKEAREINPKVPKLDKSTNIAVTFQPTKKECKEKGVAFPQKIINKTQVKTDNGNNVRPQFSVGHICYASWLLSENEINLIIVAITNFVVYGIYYDPIGLDSKKVLAWDDTSNVPPRKITTNTDIMKFKDKNNQTNENKN